MPANTAPPTRRALVKNDLVISKRGRRDVTAAPPRRWPLEID
ncbi:Hypothetical protein A7982_09208 [Minicystis rosea]|nr:Hypothetical protein A7982_09208 [Minicystis rosea]